MSIQSYFKNNYYIESKRNYLDDYSNVVSKEIDMTLSGRFLASYPNFNFDSNLFDKYPSKTDILVLQNKIKQKFNIKSFIIIGNGGNGLLQNIIKILFQKKGNLVTPFYTFNQAEYAVTSFGGHTKRVYTKNYDFEVDKILKSIDEKTKMIYICNPNNPTGKMVENKKLIYLAMHTKIPVIVDESAIEFTLTNGLLEVDDLPNNLIIIRSFSKAYGLPNLRIGYIICSDKFKIKYKENITVNEFSGMSCLMAIKIFDSIYFKKNVELIIKERTKIKTKLNELNIELINSSSNTLMTKTYFSPKFLSELEKENISVLPIYDKMNNLHIRIAVQDEKTNVNFLDKMENIILKSEFVLGVYED